MTPVAEDGAEAEPVELSLDLEAINKALLDSVGVGLAIASADSREILFNNKRFSNLFPMMAANGTIDQILDVPDLADTPPGDNVTVETEVKVRRRSVSLAVQYSCHELETGAVVMVECHNISKIKELEYMIESYSKMVERNARDLRREKERAEKLLLNIMPKTVFEELKSFGVTAPTRYDSASILMLDFIGFTEMANSLDPAMLVADLNDIFTSFDRIVEQFGCERIKTIGDAYMAVSGIPEATPDHARNIAKAALLFQRYINQRNITRKDQWLCRIGIAEGPVIGSIVGVQKYVYDIFGPGVNLAARMEQLAQPMQIVVSDTMHELIRSDFRTEPLGAVEVKGFGKREVHRLVAPSEGLDLAPV